MTIIHARSITLRELIHFIKRNIFQYDYKNLQVHVVSSYWLLLSRKTSAGSKQFINKFWSYYPNAGERINRLS